MAWQDGKVYYSSGSLFFFFCWLSLGLIVWPRLGDPFVFQNTREDSASPGRILDWAYITCSYSFLHGSQWIIFLTQSCLVLYSFCDYYYYYYYLSALLSVSYVPSTGLVKTLVEESMHSVYLCFCSLFCQ